MVLFPHLCAALIHCNYLEILVTFEFTPVFLSFFTGFRSASFSWKGCFCLPHPERNPFLRIAQSTDPQNYLYTHCCCRLARCSILDNCCCQGSSDYCNVTTYPPLTKVSLLPQKVAYFSQFCLLAPNLQSQEIPQLRSDLQSISPSRLPFPDHPMILLFLLLMMQ